VTGSVAVVALLLLVPVGALWPGDGAEAFWPQWHSNGLVYVTSGFGGCASPIGAAGRIYVAGCEGAVAVVRSNPRQNSQG
jgi:hypothetical protein